MKKQPNNHEQRRRLQLDRQTLRTIAGGEVGQVRPYAKYISKSGVVSVQFKFSIP